MPDDDGVHRKACAPHQLIEDHRQGVMQKILEQHRILHEQVPEPQIYLMVLPPGIDQYDHQLCDPGTEGCHRRTHNAQCRTSQQTEDQHCIQQDIQHQGHGIYHCGDHYPLHAAHDIQINDRYRHHREGKGQHPQVLCTLCRHIRLTGEDPHTKLRHAHPCQGKYHGHAQGDPHGNAHDPLNGARISLSPVLRRQHCSAGGDAKEDQGHDKLHLPCQGCAGQGGLADLAQHNHVRRVHRHIDEILQCHRHHQRHHHPPKLPLFRLAPQKLCLFHILFLFRISNFHQITIPHSPPPRQLCFCQKNRLPGSPFPPVPQESRCFPLFLPKCNLT